MRAIPLSKDPYNIRRRLRHSSKNVGRDAAMLANVRKPIDEWDLEELARGRPRAKDGTFKGPAPTWITPVVIAEAKRRLKSGIISQMAVYATDALAVVYKIMMSTEKDSDGRPLVSTRERMDAAKFIIEHTIGKPRQAMELESSASMTQHMLARALKVEDENGRLVDAHPVIDLTSEEWSDDEDDE